MTTIISPDQKQYHFVFMLSAQIATVAENPQGYTMMLINVDPKVLYMTARPGRSRAFLQADQFMKTWINNQSSFDKQHPQVAIIYSAMKTDINDTAKAIPIEISDPEKITKNSWIFKKLHFSNGVLEVGKYKDIVLFIDWLPAIECPEPIKLELPGLFLS